MHGFICSPTIYEYKGWIFEFSHSSGPWPLTKDYELRKRAGRRWWALWNEWCSLSDAEKKATRIGGGCQRF